MLLCLRLYDILMRQKINIKAWNFDMCKSNLNITQVEETAENKWSSLETRRVPYWLESMYCISWSYYTSYYNQKILNTNVILSIF